MSLFSSPRGGVGPDMPRLFLRGESCLSFHQRRYGSDEAHAGQQKANDDRTEAARLLFGPTLGMRTAMPAISITATTQNTHDSLSLVDFRIFRFVHRESRAAPCDRIV